MKPVIVTCLNNRPAVSEIMLLCAKRLGLEVYAAYTETQDLLLLDAYNANSVQHHNMPGAKWNAALKLALDSDATHFLIMGDDDSLSSEGYDKLYLSASYGNDYVGFKSNAYVELTTGNAMRHDYHYKCDKLIGAGRMISRRAIEAVSYAATVLIKREGLPGRCMIKGEHASLHPEVAKYLIAYGFVAAEIPPTYIGLWPNDRKSALDHWSELRLVMGGFVPKAVDDGAIHVTDFKSEINIWPYSSLEAKCKKIHPSEAVWFLGKEEREIIYKWVVK